MLNTNTSSDDNSGNDVVLDCEIHMSLCIGQTGLESKTIQDWKSSRMVHMYAAEYGFILHQVQPFMPTYNLSSYGGTDRLFRINVVVIPR